VPRFRLPVTAGRRCVRGAVFEFVPSSFLWVVLGVKVFWFSGLGGWVGGVGFDKNVVVDVGDFVDEAGLDGVLGAEVLVVGVEEFEKDLVVFDGEDGEGFGVAAVFEGIEGGTGLAGGGFGSTGAFARGGGAAGLIGHD
jgi:hypothetical protein